MASHVGSKPMWVFTIAELREEVARLKEIVREAVKEGCSCDLMYGYQCSMHKYLREIDNGT